MQSPKHSSYCPIIPTIRSEMVFRHSYPGNCPPSSDKEQIQKPKVDVENLKRHPSNTSLSSHDSGVGFSKADYEIQRAIKAQRVQRPHIIVLHKRKPVSNTNNNNNNLADNDEFEANIVVAAATASKRHRRDVQKRQTMISIGNNYSESLKRLSLLKNNSAPNLHQTISHKKINQLKEQMENEEITKENKENKEIKGIKEIKDESLKKNKPKLFKSVSISIKKFVGGSKERRRQSILIQQIHEQPRFF